MGFKPMVPYGLGRRTGSADRAWQGQMQTATAMLAEPNQARFGVV